MNRPIVRFPTLLIFLTFVLGLATAGWAADLTLTPASPLLAQSTVLSADGLELAGARIIAIYRPGSQGSYREELGRLGKTGNLVWRPRQAGLVRFEIERVDGTLVTHDVAVRVGRVSFGGVLVLLLAGIALVCGAVLGFRRGQPSS